MGLFRRQQKPNSEVGRPVFTSDHHKLGEIKEVHEGAIRIDASLGKDYWLSERDLQSNTEEGAVVIFSKAELEDYQREEPPPRDVPAGIPYTDEALISDEEQLQMRERMERELAEQRQRLHDN
jgi:hypothetical protein